MYHMLFFQVYYQVPLIILDSAMMSRLLELLGPSIQRLFEHKVIHFSNEFY